MEWSDVPVFLAVARKGSLRAAAAQLGLSQPTVGRRLQQLESSLGFTLFARYPDGHRLTERGAALLPAAEAMEEHALALERRSAAIDPSAPSVRLAAAEWPAAFLAQKLGTTVSDLPGLEIELAISNETADLARREADIAISHGLPPKGDFVTVKLAAMSCCLYASRDYARSCPASLTQDRYRVCDFVGFTDDCSHFDTMRWLAARLGPRKAAVRAVTTALQQRAIRAGAGVGILPSFLGEVDPLLTRVSAPISELDADYWMTTHRDLRHQPAVRAVLDWLTVEFRRSVDTLAGPARE